MLTSGTRFEPRLLERTTDPNPDFDGEITKGKSLDIVARGINGLPPDVKMSVMFPETCDIDADIADQIIQNGLFGSAVYG